MACGARVVGGCGAYCSVAIPAEVVALTRATMLAVAVGIAHVRAVSSRVHTVVCFRINLDIDIDIDIGNAHRRQPACVPTCFSCWFSF